MVCMLVLLFYNQCVYIEKVEPNLKEKKKKIRIVRTSKLSTIFVVPLEAEILATSGKSMAMRTISGACGLTSGTSIMAGLLNNLKEEIFFQG